MKDESVEPVARPRVFLVGDPAARPVGLERALTRAGFRLVERGGTVADPEADAILITLNDIGEGPLPELLPTPTAGLEAVPPRIVLLANANPDGPAAALALGASDALAAPVHLPELCARLHARIRDRDEQTRMPQQQDQLRDAAEALAQPGLHPDELIASLVRRLARTFDLAHCSFVAVAPGEGRARVVAEIERPAADGQLDLSRHPEIAEAIRTRRVVVKALQADHVSEAPRTLVVLPVDTGDRVAGILLLRPREAYRRLTQPQLEFAAGLARIAAAALETGEPGWLNGGEPGNGAGEIPNPQAALEELDRRVREEFERARRYSLSFSLILLGIDEFRRVHERLGQEAADRLRREVGEVLRQQLRLPDFVITYGTDDFAIVLPETGQIGARQSVIRVRERLAAVPSDEDLRADQPRFSAGIVTYPHSAISQTDDLYALVEAALLRGKLQAGERIGVAV